MASSIWTASSRVGARISARVPGVSVPASAAVMNRCRIGSTKAAVLPVPVSAVAITSSPASAQGSTALWMGRVSLKPRSATPLASEGWSPGSANAMGAGSCGACSRAVYVGGGGSGAGERPLRRGRRPGALRWGRRECDLSVVLELKLTCAEGDDAADRVVRRYADGHPVPRHDLDAEPAHPAAQLRQHFVPGVGLHAVETAAMHGNHRALDVDQIVLAQPSLPFKQLFCHIGKFRTSYSCPYGFRRSQRAYTLFYLLGKHDIVIARQSKRRTKRDACGPGRRHAS